MQANRTSGNLKDEFIAHRGKLRDAAARILGCRQRAEDVVQDAYIKVIEISPAFEVRQPVAYVYRMVRNLALDRHRRASLESVVFACEEEGMNVASGAGTPETILCQRQSLNLVACALAELPARTRHVFELYRQGEHTQRDIALQLDISTTLVNFMIRDATDHCRNCARQQGH
ncbi:RNA polymerase factor sigma-70 [Janthinobacterium fluminis]|uniref:RNA polymerase factor sigma-70 n=1 Tax=Janthinobacterium fluminis TaxID=2987524 RepID=A0ABT5K3X7_9BURK|nr:RNA polymerase factor sigma-70 [Janthinobacterium fluminis]MDC8759695.1 RNA polymerase factor sigma-70 [Janthinobacterium fluminis]